MRTWSGLRGSETSWVRLILSLRLVAVANAVVLLVVHRLTGYDGLLIGLVSGYAVLTVLLLMWFPAVTAQPWAWAADTGAALALVAFSGDWRSPFFLVAVTTLVTPAVTLARREAVVAGLAFSLAYFVLAHFVGPDPLTIGSQTTVETLATHLVLPVLVAFSSAAVADALRRLREERIRSERLAIDAERRRIAWELHDSAKARVHAGHLVLSAMRDAPREALGPAIDQVLGELEAATADMDTSLAELRSPLEGRDLDVALRERIGQLTVRGGPRFDVHGTIGDLDALTSAHVYRIASEAVINAARHARAARVDVALSQDEDGVHLVVSDDGDGMPANGARVSNGLRAMRSRARTIGGALAIHPPSEGSGTVVELHLPNASTGAQP